MDRELALLQVLDRIATALEVQASFIKGMQETQTVTEHDAEDHELHRRDVEARERAARNWEEHIRLHKTGTPHGTDADNPNHPFH